MSYTQVVLFSATVFIAVAIGWARFHKTGPAFLPFLICLSVAAANELLSFLLVKAGYSTVINNNIYVLLESLLITWQFRAWGFFNRNKNLFWLLLIFLALAWIAENLLLNSLREISFYYRVLYSFIIVLMSIQENNLLIITYRKKLLKNPQFLICTGFIIFFTYKILVEVFWLYGLNAGKDFRINVYLIMTWINLFVNLIYAIACLWIPGKPQHTTLS